MKATLMAAAALALTALAATPATSSVHVVGWSCTAIGLREGPRLPAPQRIPFTAHSQSKTDAEAAAMRKCKASHEITAGSCEKKETCWRQ